MNKGMAATCASMVLIDCSRMDKLRAWSYEDVKAKSAEKHPIPEAVKAVELQPNQPVPDIPPQPVKAPVATTVQAGQPSLRDLKRAGQARGGGSIDPRNPHTRKLEAVEKEVKDLELVRDVKMKAVE